MARIDDADAAAALRAALQDANAGVAAAARALGRREDRAAADTLAGLLQHEDATVRLAAAEGLAVVGTPEALPRIWAALRQSPDRFLEHALVLAAHRVASPDDLARALDDADPRVQRAALVLLDDSPRGNLTADAVVRLVSAGDPRLRQAAFDVLRRHAEWFDQARDVLRELIANPGLFPAGLTATAGWVVAFGADPGIQDLLAETIASGGGDATTALLRGALLRALSGANIPDPRPQLTDAVSRAIGDPEEAVRLDAIRAASALGAPGLPVLLTGIADDVAQPPAVRREALAAVVGEEHRSLSPAAFELMLASLGRSSPPTDRLVAAGIVARATLSADQLARLLPAVRGDVLLAPDGLLEMLERSAVDDGAAPETRSAVEEYLLAAARGWCPGPGEVERVLPLVGDAARDNLRATFDVRDADARAKLDRYRAVLDAGLPGDTARGRAVFTGGAVACAACHRVAGSGGLVGPDLTKVGAIRSAADLLESILVPSSTIAQGYDQYVAVLNSGERRAGTLAAQTSDAITLREPGGAELRISRDRLKDLRRLPTSIMPEGLEAGLSPQEFRDLLAYLQSLK